MWYKSKMEYEATAKMMQNLKLRFSRTSAALIGIALNPWFMTILSTGPYVASSDFAVATHSSETVPWTT